MCPYETADAEIAEQNSDSGSQKQLRTLVVIGGCLMPCLTQLPRRASCGECKQAEEYPGKLQPQHSGEPLHWTPDRLAKLFTAAIKALGGPDRLCRGTCHLIHYCRSLWCRRSGWLPCSSGRGSCWRGLRWIGRSRRIYRRHQRLSRSPCTHTQSPPKPYRVHS